MPYSAIVQLRLNVEDLLRERKESQKALADHMRVHKTTINKFLKGTREIQLADLDAMATFFGVSTYQLFQPGISLLTERRVAKRRSGRDRRIGHDARQAMSLSATLPRVPQKGGRGPQVVATSPLQEEFHRLAADYERRLAALISQAALGGQTPGARRALPPAPKGRRGGRGPDPPADE